jgi:hypothetical protein
VVKDKELEEWEIGPKTIGTWLLVVKDEELEEWEIEENGDNRYYVLF